MQLYFAPLEGVAGYLYRNAQIDLFGGADKYFAPFVSPSHNKRMMGKEIRDILPENNRQNVKLIPQLLTNNAEYFIKGAKQIYEMGYDEINFNAGCPSGTVVAKGKGAGILRDTSAMEKFFDEVFGQLEKEKIDLKISVKTRIGVDSSEEFFELLRIYNQYPFLEIIVHPRTKVQMYKGEPDMSSFEYAYQNCVNNLCYNGNIFSVEDYNQIKEKYNINAVMIGRGILKNPNLFNEIKGKEKISYKQIEKFHNRLYSEYRQHVQSEKQVLFKMKEIWNYLSYSFEEQHKCAKLVRKAQSFSQYEKAVNEILSEK